MPGMEKREEELFLQQNNKKTNPAHLLIYPVCLSIYPARLSGISECLFQKTCSENAIYVDIDKIENKRMLKPYGIIMPMILVDHVKLSPVAHIKIKIS